MNFNKIIFTGIFLLGIFSFGYAGAQAQQPQGEDKKEPKKIKQIDVMKSEAWVKAAEKIGLLPKGAYKDIKDEINSWKDMDDVKKNKSYIDKIVKDVSDNKKLIIDRQKDDVAKERKAEKIQRDFNNQIAINMKKAEAARKIEINSLANNLKGIYARERMGELPPQAKARKAEICEKLEKREIVADYCFL